MKKYLIKFEARVRWSIWLDGKLVEGGFSSRQAAADYLKKEYQS